MRRGTSGQAIHRAEDGRIMGVNLGADFTAEHEWGTKDLVRDFVLDADAAPGVPRRTARVTPLGSRWSDSPDKGVIFKVIDHPKKDKDDPYAGQQTFVVAYTPNGFGEHSLSELRFYKPFGYKDIESHPEEVKDLVGAWDGGSFAAHFGPALEQEARDLYDAIRGCDFALLWGNTFGNPFSNAGLCLAIVSRIPQEVVDDLREKDEDNDALNAAVEADGTKAAIDKFNDDWRASNHGWRPPCGYYALSPSWDNKEKGTIEFFLNPMAQDSTNSGWFKPDDLKLWMEGKGPIPMTAEQIAEKAARYAK